MKYEQFGKDNKDVIILLHGGGLSWWNYREEANKLKDDFRVILPILDGHACSDRPFTTIEDNAAEIIQFIDERVDGHVKVLGGLSLGAQIVLEILSQRSDICDHAIVESALLIPSKATKALVGPAINLSYWLIKMEWFSKLQFAQFYVKEDYYKDYYRDSCLISKQDMIAFMKANASFRLKKGITETKADVHIYAGGMEKQEMIKSALMMHMNIPRSILCMLDRLTHGQFSMNHADRYVEDIRKMTGKAK